MYSLMHSHQQLSFVQGDGSGYLEVSFEGNPLEGANAACNGGVQWPQIATIQIVGVGKVDTSSVTLQVKPLLCGSPCVAYIVKAVRFCFDADVQHHRRCI